MDPQASSTIVSSGVAENIKEAVGFVTMAVTPESSSSVAPAGLSGFGDGVLYGSITQPASVAPVQPTFPGLVELLE